jgi:hypothetical protein
MFEKMPDGEEFLAVLDLREWHNSQCSPVFQFLRAVAKRIFADAIDFQWREAHELLRTEGANYLDELPFDWSKHCYRILPFWEMHGTFGPLAPSGLAFQTGTLLASWNRM